MNDYEKILESFEPDKFQRKDLRKQWLPVSAYTIKLDIYAEWLEELLEETEEELKEVQAENGRAGSPQYMADAKEWGSNWNELQRTLGMKDAEIIRKEAENGVLKEELKRKDKEISYLYEREEELLQKIWEQQQQLMAYESTGTRTQRTRDTSGRFTSDLSKKEKEKIAYDMRKEGHSWAEIADRLHVAPDTAKQYAERYARWLKEYRRPVGGENEQREQSGSSYW